LSLSLRYSLPTPSTLNNIINDSLRQVG
jgi:hypothetical protein